MGGFLGRGGEVFVQGYRARVTLGCPVKATRAGGSEADALAKLVDGGGIARAAAERVGGLGHGDIERDACKPATEQGLLGVFTQARGTGGGAADAQVGNLVDAFQDRVEAAEMGKQRGGGLGADTGHPRDVVDGIAAQRQVIGDLVRMHAHAFEYACGAPANILREIPLLVMLAEQLAEVLVRRNDHAAETV
jgi:hypothetical protein